MVTRITLVHAEGNVTKCRDKTSYVIELETIHVSRRHFRDILQHCPAKPIHAVWLDQHYFAGSVNGGENDGADAMLTSKMSGFDFR